MKVFFLWLYGVNAGLLLIYVLLNLSAICGLIIHIRQDGYMCHKDHGSSNACDSAPV